MSIEISDDEIQKYVSLISQCNSADEKIKNEASNEIGQKVSSDLLRILLILSEIILKDGIDYDVVYLSLSWIKQIFTPIPQVMTDEDIACKWFEVEETYRTKVKEAIIKGFLFPEEKITQIATKAFCTLLNIEKSQMFGMIPILYQLYESPNSSDFTQTAVINTLAKISSKNSLGGHTDLTEVETIIIEIIKKINTYFADSIDKSLSIRYNIAYTYDILLDSLPQNGEYYTPLMNICLQNLEKIPESADSNIKPYQFHSILLSILLKIIKIQYTNDDFHPDAVFDYIDQKILDYKESSENQYKICDYLQFWTFLANHEREIIKKNNYIDKLINKPSRYNYIDYRLTPEIFRDFCSKSITKLTDKILSIMYMIDPNDLDSEDVSVKRPHHYATSCMQSFFKLQSEGVFLKIKEHWTNDMKLYYKELCKMKEEKKNSKIIIPSLNWMNDHALLLTICIFCRKTIINNLLQHQIISFFNDYFEDDFIILRDYILGTCLHALNVPKIVDTCLYCLSLIYHNYPDVLNEEGLNIIFEWTKEIMNIKDPIIFDRILQLYAVITTKKVMKILDLNVKHKILRSFDLYSELFSVAISRSDAINCDIYKNAYILISNMTRCSICTSIIIDNTSKITKLITDQLSMLKDNSDYMKIKQILHFFNTIFNINKNLIQHFIGFVKPIIDEYLKMANLDSPILKDILKAINIIMLILADEDYKYLIKVNDLINSILDLQNHSIITYLLYIRSSIYNKFISNKYPEYEDLLNKFEKNYDMIIGCLDNFSREHYPLLLKALGLLINSCSNYISNSNPGIVESFINQYIRFVNMPISANNEDDINYANDFYDGLFIFGNSIMKSINETSEFKSNRKIMRILIVDITENYFKNLQFHFSSDSMLSFFGFINQFNSTFGRKGNIMISRKVNFKIMYNGMLSEDKEVRNQAESTIENIRYA